MRIATRKGIKSTRSGALGVGSYEMNSHFKIWLLTTIHWMHGHVGLETNIVGRFLSRSIAFLQNFLVSSRQIGRISTTQVGVNGPYLRYAPRISQPKLGGLCYERTLRPFLACLALNGCVTLELCMRLAIHQLSRLDSVLSVHCPCSSRVLPWREPEPEPLAVGRMAAA